MTQSVKYPALGFGSGHNPTVCEFEPHVGFCTNSADPAWDSLSLPLSLSLFASFLLLSALALSLSLSLSLSLKINKHLKIEEEGNI